MFEVHLLTIGNGKGCGLCHYTEAAVEVRAHGVRWALCRTCLPGWRAAWKEGFKLVEAREAAIKRERRHENS